MSPVLVPLLSSAIALVRVALGAWINGRSSGRQWIRETQLHPCQQAMDEFALLYDGLALSRRGQVPDLNCVPWNRALTGLAFVCPAEVVEAAYELDETLWRADWEIRGGSSGQTSWTRLRRPIDDARDRCFRAARSHVSRGLRQPARFTGRPTDDDPIWSTRSNGPVTE
jgi:hypothetical protein